MTKEKIYHIYAKNRCIYHSLNYEQFQQAWDMLQKLISIFGDITKDDLTYEELTLEKDIIQNSSH